MFRSTFLRLPGFIQRERLAAEHEFFAWAARSGETWGLDLFTWEPELLGRGLGPQVIRAFMALICAARPLRRFVVGPDSIGQGSRNLRALRAYEQTGFRRVAVYGTLTLMTPDLL